jgi:hypothetical protein
MAADTFHIAGQRIQKRMVCSEHRRSVFRQLVAGLAMPRLQARGPAGHEDPRHSRFAGECVGQPATHLLIALRRKVDMPQRPFGGDRGARRLRGARRVGNHLHDLGEGPGP